MKALYNNDRFRNFVRIIFSQRKLHRRLNASGDCAIEVLKPGFMEGWHFELSGFTASFMLQNAESGGRYQMADFSDGIPDYTAISLIINEERDKLPVGTKSACFEPGTLFIFKRYTCMNRVTKCQGKRDQIIATLTYTKELRR